MLQKKDKTGAVYITSLALMLIILTMGMILTSVSKTEIRIRNNQRDALEALYNAESGMEHAIAEILNGVDVDGDGLGNIPLKDVDGDGDTDYAVTYDAASGTISVQGSEGQYGKRNLTVEISESPGTKAMHVGGAIDSVSNVTGTINGDVHTGGAIDPSWSMTITGTVTENDPAINVFTPTMLDYQDYADTGLADCSSLGSNPPGGVYFIDGDCTKTGSLTLNGSLIVNGDLTLGPSTTINITPAGSDPAIVANNNISIFTSNSMTINGLLYARGNMQLAIWAFNSTVNGAIVAGGTLTLDSIDNLTLNYDANLNPPFFSDPGVGGVSIVSWKGRN